MLKQFFHDELSLGLAQAAVAAFVALFMVLLARRRGIHLESDATIALLRGLVQSLPSDRSCCYCCRRRAGPARFFCSR